MSPKTRHQNGVTKMFHFQAPPLAKSWLHSCFESEIANAILVGKHYYECIIVYWLSFIQNRNRKENQYFLSKFITFRLKLCNVIQQVIWFCTKEITWSIFWNRSQNAENDHSLKSAYKSESLTSLNEHAYCFA